MRFDKLFSVLLIGGLPGCASRNHDRNICVDVFPAEDGKVDVSECSDSSSPLSCLLIYDDSNSLDNGCAHALCLCDESRPQCFKASDGATCCESNPDDGLLNVGVCYAGRCNLLACVNTLP